MCEEDVNRKLLVPKDVCAQTAGLDKELLALIQATAEVEIAAINGSVTK